MGGNYKRQFIFALIGILLIIGVGAGFFCGLVLELVSCGGAFVVWLLFFASQQTFQGREL
jgi:hypothetical protein